MSSLQRFYFSVAIVLYLLQPSLQSNISIDLRIEAGQITVGGLAKFTCTVTGVQVTGFMWKHNGAAISPFDNTLITHNGNIGVLTIHNVPQEKAGNYTCIPVVNGTITSTEQSVVLTLAAPPTILAEPSQYAVLGSDVIVNCTFTGEGVSMLWKKNGESLASDDTQYDVSTLGFLKFENANLNDTGDYTCTASNNVGSVSKTIMFTVLTFPKFSVYPDTTISVRSREQTILNCEAMGINTPTISWRVGGEDVESLNSSRLASYGNGSLVINDTIFKDVSKPIACVATNRAGIRTSATNLNVTGPPEFTKPPQDTTVSIGKSATIYCSYEAIPIGVHEWTKITQGRIPTKIDSTYSDRYQIADNGDLMISMTSDEDNGQFSCAVSNAINSISEIIQLTVISPPNAPEAFTGAGTPGERTFTVVWQAPTIVGTTQPVGEYIITVVCTSSVPEELQNITVTKNQTKFTFDQLLPGNDYVVYATAKNDAGLSKSTNTVTFKTVASVPSLSSLVASKSDNINVVEFEWILDFDGGHEISSFSIEYRVVNSEPEVWTGLNSPGLNVTEGRYTPVILPPKGEYIFRAVVNNMLGRGVFQFPGTYTLPEAVPGQPSKPTSSEITSDSITLSLMLNFLGTTGVSHFRINITGDERETKTISATGNMAYSSNTLLTVDGLESDTTYSFTIAAENDIGVGPYSEMSDEITTDLTVYYIIAGVVGGLVIVAVIVVATLFLCYLWNKKRMTKHQICTSEVSNERKDIQVLDAKDLGEADFANRYENRLPRHFNSVSDIIPSNPVERSFSLQNKTTHTAPTISYSLPNHPNRSASLSQPCRSNGFVTMPPMARNQMFSSATVISYGSGSHVGSYNKHWSPSTDSIPGSISRERRSPSSNYNSDTLGSRITNLATDV